MDKSWFLNFLLKTPNLRSGYWLQPKSMRKSDYMTSHDFHIYNPSDKDVGSLNTSISPRMPGVIRIDDVFGFPTDEAGNILSRGTPSGFGIPGALGVGPTRDLARQLHGYYKEMYPNTQFDQIGGTRISGARANGPVQYNYAGAPLPVLGEMRTRFKPAIAGGAVGLGGAGALDDWSNAEDPRTYLNPFMPRP